MAEYTIRCFSKGGDDIKFQDLDYEICELWGVAQNKEQWATPPNIHYSKNWHDFIFTLIYYSMPESGIATIDHLLQFYLKDKKTMSYEFMNYIKDDLFYISLLLYLKNRKLFFTIQY